jgi:hypothetical protein
MESLKHLQFSKKVPGTKWMKKLYLQFSKKVPGTKWMKKLIQLCRFIDLHFMVHESKVEGVCSVGKKNVCANQVRDG